MGLKSQNKYFREKSGSQVFDLILTVRKIFYIICENLKTNTLFDITALKMDISLYCKHTFLS